MKKVIIAIDGYAACGKSATAKQVAHRLGYNYIDSGAMYRAVTLFFLEKNVNLKSHSDIMTTLNQCNITCKNFSIFLNGVAVDREIRTQRVNEKVSKVSAIPEVRKRMIVQQQAFGRNKGVVMDGRDIGTVVFPHAELKLFMTADIDVRVERRRKELQAKGIFAHASDIKKNLMERDYMDSDRTNNPLRKAEDAIEINTSDLTLNGQVTQIVALAQKIINEN